VVVESIIQTPHVVYGAGKRYDRSPNIGPANAVPSGRISAALPADRHSNKTAGVGHPGKV